MEIGGYLEFEKYQGAEYHSECLKINTARNCLKYLIEARSIKKLWLSRWNCSAVLDACIQSGIDIAHFDLDAKFNPVMPPEYKTEDYVYVVNYYGQLSDVHFEHMIMDNVQAFFQKPQQGVDTLYSCRKYFGVTDGAYLYTDSELGRELDQDCSHDRIGYLAGRLEKSGSEFYHSYHDNEERLDSLPLMRMSAFTENILRSIDYDSIKQRREENYRFLSEKLRKYNEFEASYPPGPFAYPFLTHNGNRLRERLRQQRIYVAKLWPNVTGPGEGDIADNLLPLPCDQRYSQEEMQIMAECITRESRG